METNADIHAAVTPAPLLYSQLPESMRHTMMVRNQRNAGLMNGPVLDTADWMSSVFNTPQAAIASIARWDLPSP